MGSRNGRKRLRSRRAHVNARRRRWVRSQLLRRSKGLCDARKADRLLSATLEAARAELFGEGE